MAIAISFLACLFTLTGGTVALRIEQHRALVIGFSAGAVIGVALFDLMPEAAENAHSTDAVFALVGVGYATYHLLHHAAARYARGNMGGATLTAHSLLDGMSIGFSFQVSMAAGIVVAIGVIVHDMCDGINTVTVVQRGGGTVHLARRWLVADALAPIVGATAATLIRLDPAALGLVLAVFGGFFLYIGASDLLPAGVRGDSVAPSIMAALGMAVLLTAVRLASL